jgi:protein MAK11
VTNRKVQYQQNMRSYIVCGSYTGVVYGLQLTQSTDGKYALTPAFSSASHASPITHIASGATHVVSASADEKLGFFDLAHMREDGMSIHTSGHISALLFPDATHLLSATRSGLLVAHSATWDVMLEKVAHRKGLMACAAHPSGKLVLSLGSDHTLKLWETAKMRCLSGIPLPREKISTADFFLFTSDGQYVVLVQMQRMIFFKAPEMTIAFEKDHVTKITAIHADGDANLLIGDEKGGIYRMHVTTQTVSKVATMGVRVKGVGHIAGGLLCCACSDGSVYVLREGGAAADVVEGLKKKGGKRDREVVDAAENSEAEVLAKMEIAARITAFACLDVSDIKEKQSKTVEPHAKQAADVAVKQEKPSKGKHAEKETVKEKETAPQKEKLQPKQRSATPPTKKHVVDASAKHSAEKKKPALVAKAHSHKAASSPVKQQQSKEKAVKFTPVRPASVEPSDRRAKKPRRA